jgi:Skp family chaperone for outer membrane proteins
MKRIRLSVFTFLFISAASISNLAQTTSSPKVGYIDSGAFYDTKDGITKLVNANKQLDTEFAVRIKELQDGNTRLQSIAKELDNMQKLPQTQFRQAEYAAKQDEGERLQRELNYKKTDLETAINKRKEQLIGPISKDIGIGIDDFAKKNGYGVIFDIGKFADAGAVLYFADAADSTKEFITFYNARPVTTSATSAKPN